MENKISKEEIKEIYKVVGFDNAVKLIWYGQQLMIDYIGPSEGTKKLLKKHMEFIEILSKDLKSIRDKVGNIEVGMAGIVQEIIEKADKRYARKSIEGDVKDIKDKNESRLYNNFIDGIKYGIAFGMSYLLFLVTK